MDEENHPGIADLLPEGAIPIASIRGAIYLSADGKERYSVQSGGDSDIAKTLGLVRVVEHHLLREFSADAAD